MSILKNLQSAAAGAFGGIHQLTFSNTKSDRAQVHAEGRQSPLVGKSVPEVTLMTDHGESLVVSQLWSAGHAVLLFYRGYWCPSCTGYMRVIAETADQLEAAGASVTAISNETPDDLKRMRSNAGLPERVRLLSDPDAKLAGMLAGRYPDKPYFVPAAIVIDPTGVVRFAYANHDPRVRAATSEILTILKELA